ncbi:uncharacterized protein M6B38_163940 [Iris pallida]|uniref:Uncharacterized protein n=1 Tax=Iris pallida TaxID=29817 RepID=A0AAX6EYR0_IRIPA|nr:uncharacterized protein M6B38_163940 [Iris pallida]
MASGTAAVAAAGLELELVLSPKNWKGWMMMDLPYSGRSLSGGLLLHKPGTIPVSYDTLPLHGPAFRNENIPPRKTASASAAADTSGLNAEPMSLRPPASEFQWLYP